MSGQEFKRRFLKLGLSILSISKLLDINISTTYNLFNKFDIPKSYMFTLLYFEKHKKELNKYIGGI